jgi:hypothetical protein
MKQRLIHNYHCFRQPIGTNS